MTEDTSGAGSTSAESQLVTICDEWSRAIAGNDVERMAAVMADDWAIVSESGVGSREEFLSLVRSRALTHSAMDRISEARVRVYGDSAVLTARMTNTAHYDGRRFDADEWVTDVFVHRDGRWSCVLSQITAVSGAPV